MAGGVKAKLEALQEAVEAAQTYPGAVKAARGILNWLRALYRENPRSFTAPVIRQIRECKERLPKGWVDLMKCPVCQGAGTERWMRSYKHTCNRCGGWRWVEKTAEAVREQNWIWGRSPAGT